MQVLADSLRFDRKYILIPELVPSTHYNVTTKEVYAVPIVEKMFMVLSAMRIGKREFIGGATKSSKNVSFFVSTSLICLIFV